jgi:Leucine-rich repeat (LRR) protein
MQYLDAKNDLLSYPTHYIKLLARYYHLPRVNRNDLLWLIAISNLSTIYHYAEMTPSKAWEEYGDVLLMRFSNDDSAKKYRTTESLPKEIIDADPTNNKKYLQWIITSYLDGGIKRLEDMGRINTALKEYMYLSLKKFITNTSEQNINAFCGLSGCKQGKKEKIGLDEFLEQYEDKLQVLRKKEEIQIAEQDAKKIFEDDNLLVIQPLTEQASCKYGAGTKWCTAAKKDNMFEEYSKKGPIYILIPKEPNYTKEKYQISIEAEQFMNEKDEEVNYNYLINRFPELKTIDEFRDWINMEELYFGRINTEFFTNIVRLYIKKGLQESTLKDLVKVLENNKNLEQLTITDQTFLPDSIGNLINLRILKLADNQLIFLSDSIGNLTKLRILKLADNQLIFLSDSIGNLTKLEELDLSDNQLTFLPDSIGNLTNLQQLDLYNNQISFLPDSIGNLTNLRQLNLDRNHLTFIPDSIKNLTKLEELNLNDNRLTFIPDSIGNLTILHTLNVVSNQLTFISDSIGNLTILQKLNLSNNQLTFIPDSIGNLTNFQELSLNDNRLTFLPDSIGNLHSLISFTTSMNSLTFLPDTIKNLKSLLSLNLAENSLTFIPDSIGNLTNLRLLTLNDNLLTSIPDTIGNMLNIFYLDLTNNPINCLPKTFLNKKIIIHFGGYLPICK